MNIVKEVRAGVKDLDIGPFVSRDIVTVTGEKLDANAKAQIWAFALSQGYGDAGRFFEDYGVTDDENLSIMAATYKENLRREFADMQMDAPDPLSFDEYFDSFPAKLLLADGRWLLWTE